MKNNVIIAIGRQFGSGGHEIGNKLSSRLDIPLYDRNLIRMAAEEMEISDKTVETVDETGINKFIAYYTSPPYDYASYYSNYINNPDFAQPLSEQVYSTQSKIIKKLAERSSCIVIGRCADYILAGNPGLISVFITADKDARTKRIAWKYDISERKAADRIKKIDRERKYYYETHTGQDWGASSSHQVILNVSRLGTEQAVSYLEQLYKMKYAELNPE